MPRHFSARANFYSPTHRSRRSHTAERMALIVKGAAWFPCLAPDPNAHFIIRQTDTDIFTWCRNGRGIWRHVAVEIRGPVYRTEGSTNKQQQRPLALHTHTHTHPHPHTHKNTDTHRHPRLYTPEWRQTHSPRFEVCLEWQAE